MLHSSVTFRSLALISTGISFIFEHVCVFFLTTRNLEQKFWETAPQIALGNCSKEAARKGQYTCDLWWMGNCCCSFAQSYPPVCDTTDCSRPGFPVLHYLLEFSQTHDHWVDDAIQPSHPLSSPSPPALSFLESRVFSNETALCLRWPKYWGFSFSISPSNEYSGLISFRIDWFDLLAIQGIILH